MARWLDARVRRLEEMIATSDVLTTEDGLRIALEPYELLDAWLHVMAQEPLGVQPTTRWALATAVVPDGDHGLAVMKAAARAELAAEAGA